MAVTRRAGADHDDATRMLEAIAAAFDGHDLEGIMANFADDAVFDGPRGTEPWGTRFVGRDEIREAFAARVAGIPDVRDRGDEHFVDGDREPGGEGLAGGLCAKSPSHKCRATPFPRAGC